MMRWQPWSRSAELNIVENFLRLQEHFTETGVRMHMYLVDEEALAAIDPDPAQYEVVEDRDSFDYIYSGEEMRLLPGRKYSKMKNRISRFQRDYGDRAEFVLLGPEDEPEILQFLDRWSSKKESDDALNRLTVRRPGYGKQSDSAGKRRSRLPVFV